jgi:hypothetical protein
MLVDLARRLAVLTGSCFSGLAVAVANGTAALHLSALALNVNETSNIITTPVTFAASANCIRYCRGNVFFADIEKDSYLLDLNKVETLIRSKSSGFFTGIIPVDLAGRAVNLEEYRTLADKYDLWIIEDACHAPGGYFIDSNREKKFCGNGKFSELAIFSFHPVKHIACGEGGMITTNDETLYKKLLLLRTHGITKDPCLLHENHGGWYYEMQELGYNYRLTDFQAALGISQLERADEGLQWQCRRGSHRFSGEPQCGGRIGVGGNWSGTDDDRGVGGPAAHALHPSHRGRCRQCDILDDDREYSFGKSQDGTHHRAEHHCLPAQADGGRPRRSLAVGRSR